MATHLIAHMATLLLAAALLIFAAINDARHFRIPNRVCIALLILFPVYKHTALHSLDLHQHIMVALLVLASGFAMFMANLAGAGDVKLLASISLWVGPHYIAPFIIITALAGGVLSLIMALRHYQQKKKLSPHTSISMVTKLPIPYGIAIACGGISTFGIIAKPLVFNN